MNFNSLVLIFQTIKQAQVYFQVLNWKLAIVTILHAINGSYAYRRNLLNQGDIRIPFIQGFVSYILMSLGGTLTAGLLMGQTAGWLVNDNVLPLYFLVYCIFFLDRNAYITRFISKGGQVTNYISTMIDATSRTITLSGIIDTICDSKDVRLNNSIIMLIVCGTIAGCGGGIIEKTFSLSKKDWKYKTPSSLKGENSYSLKATLCFAIMYIVLSLPINQSMIGLFGLILETRKHFFGNYTRIEAKALTWLSFLLTNIFHTYLMNKRKAMTVKVIKKE